MDKEVESYSPGRHGSDHSSHIILSREGGTARNILRMVFSTFARNFLTCIVILYIDRPFHRGDTGTLWH